MGIWEKIVGKVSGGKVPLDLAYEDERGLLTSPRTAVRVQLAANVDTRPESLFYLAEDDSAVVRRKVAANPATPVLADRLLAADSDAEVREEIARKVTRLLPELSAEEMSSVGEKVVAIVDLVAQDQLARIRCVVAQELAKSTHVPRDTVLRLARDMESIVAVPVLEYSPLLNDTDLIEIISAGVAAGGLEAISRRASVSEDVADAVVATMDVPAVASLLRNENADIRRNTIEEVVNNAAEIADWHEPLVARPDLSHRAVRRISGFVASELIEQLIARHQSDASLLKELKKAVGKRIAREKAGAAEKEAQDYVAAKEVALTFQESGITDDAICEMIDIGAREKVVHSLAMLSSVAAGTIERILSLDSGVLVVAVCWRAGLSMRTALRVQMDIAKVSPTSLVPARGGVDYPYSGDELESQLKIITG